MLLAADLALSMVVMLDHLKDVPKAAMMVPYWVALKVYLLGLKPVVNLVSSMVVLTVDKLGDLMVQSWVLQKVDQMVD